MGGWLTFGESMDSRFISRPDVPAIVLVDIYRTAHTTCLTMSCCRGMFDIYCPFIGTVGACIVPVRKRGMLHPGEPQPRTDIVLCVRLYLWETGSGDRNILWA